MSSSQKNKKQRRDDSENTEPYQNGYSDKRKGKPTKYEVETPPESDAQTHDNEDEEEMGLAGILTVYAEDEEDEDMTFYDYVHRADYDRPSYMVPADIMEEAYAEPVASLEHIINKQEKRQAEKKRKAKELADREGAMEGGEDAEEMDNDENL